jgi:hypothetical protein
MARTYSSSEQVHPVGARGHQLLASDHAISAEGTRGVSLPVRASEIALDTRRRLDALEGNGVTVYEVTVP